jgi:uncharacterized membrane protein YqhA
MSAPHMSLKQKCIMSVMMLNSLDLIHTFIWWSKWNYGDRKLKISPITSYFVKTD